VNELPHQVSLGVKSIVMKLPSFSRNSEQLVEKAFLWSNSRVTLKIDHRLPPSHGPSMSPLSFDQILS
jgi:hypothetical protein